MLSIALFCPADDLMSAATVLQSVLSFPTYPPLGSALRNTYDKKGSDFKVRAARMDLEPKTKRVWRRWDHEEERRLRDAVLKLGTKDWSSIHEEMQTDRSIKQLQDHWNDTKNNRMSKV